MKITDELLMAVAPLPALPVPCMFPPAPPRAAPVAETMMLLLLEVAVVVLFALAPAPAFVPVPVFTALPLPPSASLLP